MPQSRRGRFIPTPVGQTLPISNGGILRTVHPHTRGADLNQARFRGRGHGSSPHPWGRPVHLLLDSTPFRFIPTPVGQTPDAVRTIAPLAVHPHTRGADYLPRRFGRNSVRFIPTPVGQTFAGATFYLVMPVPPHTRGADLLFSFRLLFNFGSSPHPWGRRIAVLLKKLLRRFIPTPVGQTARSHRPRRRITVHPHTRGADTDVLPPVAVGVGSSPHPWGRPAGAARRRTGLRFIPTPVGQTSCRAVWPAEGRVHPHTRGADERLDRRNVVGVRFIPTPVGQTS